MPQLIPVGRSPPDLRSHPTPPHISSFIAVAMCNVAQASQNAYLVLVFYHCLCLKRSDQSYISRLLMAIVYLIPALNLRRQIHD